MLGPGENSFEFMFHFATPYLLYGAGVVSLIILTLFIRKKLRK